MATLTVTASHDYSGETLSNITEIDFSNSSITATFGAGQFNGTQISSTVHIVDNSGTGDEVIDVLFPSASTFSAAGWTFTNGSMDNVLLFGSSGADHITGSSQLDIFHISGADVVDGGGGGDQFFINAASDLAAGAQINGGAGDDELFMLSSGTYDFSAVTLSSIEFLLFNGFQTNITAIFPATQLADVAVVEGEGASTSAHMIVNGSSINLSAVNFFAWDDRNDTITLNGTSGADSLIGSNQNDTIIGGHGNDTMSGGPGDDVFVYNGTLDVAFGTTTADAVDGGDGFDSLRVTATTDFTNSHASFTSIEGLQFQASAIVFVTFRSDEFGATLISNNLAVTGDSNEDFINVLAAATGNFDASHWTFTTWSAIDILEIVGSVTGADHLIGSSQHDIIEGFGGADILDGGLGADTLTGGPGDDRFVFGPGYGADTIGDFAAGAGTDDKIDLTSFQVTFGQVLSHATQVGGDTVIDFGSGDTLTLQHVTKTILSVDDFVGLTSADNDFNDDFHSDVVLRNDDGRMSIWEMNGQTLLSGATVANAPLLDPSWHTAGTGDFNSDGKADIVLRNDDGRIGIWEMDGQSLLSGATVSNAPLLDPSWHNAGTGDFNFDGKSDILLRDDDGRVAVWEMNGQSLLSGAAISNAPLLDPSWHVANHAPDLA